MNAPPRQCDRDDVDRYAVAAQCSYSTVYGRSRTHEGHGKYQSAHEACWWANLQLHTPPSPQKGTVTARSTPRKLRTSSTSVGQWYVAKHPQSGLVARLVQCGSRPTPRLPGPSSSSSARRRARASPSSRRRPARSFVVGAAGASGRGLPFGRGGSRGSLGVHYLSFFLDFLRFFSLTGAAPFFRFFFFFGAAAEAWLAANASSMLLAFAAWADS